MGNLFTGMEIVKLGIRIEENGRDFYNELVNKSENSRAIGVFKHLEGEEEKHIAVFQKMLDSLEKQEQTESFPGEYAGYMQDLAGKNVFTQENVGVEAASKTGSDKEAVDLGIGFEKDSIIFYEGMKKVTSGTVHKAIDQLIAQEQTHLEKLNELKKRS